MPTAFHELLDSIVRANMPKTIGIITTHFVQSVPAIWVSGLTVAMTPEAAVKAAREWAPALSADVLASDDKERTLAVHLANKGNELTAAIETLFSSLTEFVTISPTVERSSFTN